MNEELVNTTENEPPLEDKSEKEVSARLANNNLFYELISSVILTINILVFVYLNPHIGENNIAFRICYNIATITPILLTTIATLLFKIPLVQWRLAKKGEELPLNRDKKEIANRFFHPNTKGYKVNRVIRIFSTVTGLLIFLMNIILIFIGVFRFVIS
ncbi:MAG: hypothetical protein JXA54_15240 [Candidatus Heimdallarchaeota archaeon]|nr:hypothetical protein [Candidatus Heimdallarchaeota archaeon]